MDVPLPDPGASPGETLAPQVQALREALSPPGGESQRAAVSAVFQLAAWVATQPARPADRQDACGLVPLAISVLLQQLPASNAELELLASVIDAALCGSDIKLLDAAWTGVENLAGRLASPEAQAFFSVRVLGLALATFEKALGEARPDVEPAKLKFSISLFLFTVKRVFNVARHQPIALDALVPAMCSFRGALHYLEATSVGELAAGARDGGCKLALGFRGVLMQHPQPEVAAAALTAAAATALPEDPLGGLDAAGALLLGGAALGEPGAGWQQRGDVVVELLEALLAAAAASGPWLLHGLPPHSPAFSTLHAAAPSAPAPLYLPTLRAACAGVARLPAGEFGGVERWLLASVLAPHPAACQLVLDAWAFLLRRAGDALRQRHAALLAAALAALDGRRSPLHADVRAALVSLLLAASATPGPIPAVEELLAPRSLSKAAAPGPAAGELAAGAGLLAGYPWSVYEGEKPRGELLERMQAANRLVREECARVAPRAHPAFPLGEAAQYLASALRALRATTTREERPRCMAPLVAALADRLRRPGADPRPLPALLDLAAECCLLCTDARQLAGLCGAVRALAEARPALRQAAADFVGTCGVLPLAGSPAVLTELRAVVTAVLRGEGPVGRTLCGKGAVEPDGGAWLAEAAVLRALAAVAGAGCAAALPQLVDPRAAPGGPEALARFVHEPAAALAHEPAAAAATLAEAECGPLLGRVRRRGEAAHRLLDMRRLAAAVAAACDEVEASVAAPLPPAFALVADPHSLASLRASSARLNLLAARALRPA